MNCSTLTPEKLSIYLRRVEFLCVEAGVAWVERERAVRVAKTHGDRTVGARKGRGDCEAPLGMQKRSAMQAYL